MTEGFLPDGTPCPECDTPMQRKVDQIAHGCGKCEVWWKERPPGTLDLVFNVSFADMRKRDRAYYDGLSKEAL